MHWGKILQRIAVVLGVAICGIVIAGFFVLRSQWFHRVVLAEIVEKGQAATGGRLTIQSWNFHLHPLVVELYGIVLRGSEPASTIPLLEVEKLTVGVKVGALLDRKLELSELLVAHPVVNLIVGPDGSNNLPTPTNTKSNTTVWSLAVGRTVVDQGELFYNNTQSRLNADLYHLRAKVRFDPAQTRYMGSLSYRNGRLHWGNYPVLPHALDVQFSATPTGTSIDSMSLTLGSSQIRARGQLVNYQSPDVQAKYEILIHTPDFSAFSAGVSPAGDVRLDGEMHYRDIGGRPFLRTLSADGNVTSSDIQADSTQARVRVRNLAARYRLAAGDLDVHDITADVIGGRIRGELIVHNLETQPSGTFRASLRHGSIESAKLLMKRKDVRRMPVTGTVDAGVRGAWTPSLKNLRLFGDAQVTAAVWTNPFDRKLATPVDATLHFLYDELQKNLTLRQTSVRIPAASFVLNGEIGDHSNLQVHATSSDLHRLAEIAASLRSSSESSMLPLDISGKATLDGEVIGSLERPNVSAQIAAQNLQVQGSRWKTAQIVVSANPSEVKIAQASLVSAQQGTLRFTTDVRLTNWSYLPSNAVTANLSARGISLGELGHLANLHSPISGDLSTNVSLHGSELHPSGQGSFHIVKASAYNQPIQDIAVQFRTRNDSIDSQLTVTLPAGSASGTVQFTPKTKAYNLNLQAPEIVIQRLQAVTAGHVPVTGTLTIAAAGTGTIDDPHLNLTLRVPALQIRNTTATDVDARVNVDNRHAHVTLNSNLAQAYVRGDASVDLVGNFDTQASIDTSKIPLGPFLAVYAPGVPAGFTGETEVHASLHGPLKNASRIVAHLTVPTLTGAYQSLQFANAGPIRADYADSVLVIQPAEILGTQTSFRLQGHVPIGNEAPMNVRAQGSVNLQLLAIFDADLQSGGVADFDVQGTGNLAHPNVQGKIQIRNAALSTSTAPVGISKVNGTLDLTNNKIQVTSLTGEIGGGQVSAGGSIALRPSLQFNLALQGKNMRVLYPPGVRSVLDCDLTFTGNMAAGILRGRTLIDSLNFTPDFNLSTVSSQFNTPSVPPLNQTFSDNIKLAVSVLSAQSLTARSSQLTVSGMANLRIDGTVANPVVIGRIDLSSGELFFMSNRYELQRGIVSFNDPTETRPVLDVQVTTTVEQYDLTIGLTGPLDRLTTSYVSNPALPTADIISLIYRGQTVQEAASAGTSTDSLLAGSAASEFSSGLRNLTGISSLQIDPLLGGAGTNPSARIAVQQRVTKDFLFTFSTDVTQPESEIILGQYQFTPRWSVNVERDQLGGISVDGQLRTKF